MGAGLHLMAELLVRVVDKTHPDAAADVGCLKRGDVIAVCPDGWRWGNAELRNPAWRILRVPGAPEAFDALLSPEVPDLGAEDGPRRKRGFRLDIDALSAADPAFAAHLGEAAEAPYAIDQADGTRVTIQARAAVKFDGLTRGAITAAIARKPALALPNVLGVDRRVIG